MSFHTLLSLLKPRSARTAVRPAARANSRRPWRPGVEWLEDRLTPATTVVDTFVDVVADDGMTSLREAIALAADPATHAGDDTVVLPNEIGGVAGTYALSLGQLLIDDATGRLSIQSEGGPVTIDARGASSVFFISGGEVALQGLTITGGFNLFGGGGIANYGTLTVTGCVITGNAATYYGGGIDNIGTLTLNGSTVSGNSAKYGGGINNFFSSARLTLTRANLSDNSAEYGGGLYNNGTATVTSSSIFRNRAPEHDGGGIWNGETGILTLTGSTISTNSAAFGGGIYNVGAMTVDGIGLFFNAAGYGGGLLNHGTATVVDGSIKSNSAAQHDGGGIWNGPAGTLDIDSTLLEGNSAAFGGGIYNVGAATVARSRLEGNSAGYGGGIVNRGPAATLVVTGGTLTGNSAASEGGGVWNWDKAALTITGGTLTGNSAGYGGGIYNGGATVGVAGSTLTDNTAASSGGGVLNADAAELTVTGSALTANSAPFGGGILSSGTAALVDSTLDGNTADSGGGIYNFGEGTLTVSDSTLSGNRAARDAGGIWNDRAATLSVSNSTLSGNSALGAFSNGGGILSFGETAVADSTLDGNSADSGGGILSFGEAAALTVTGSTFTGNSAAVAGGGINSLEKAALTVTGSTFTGNSAVAGGGIRNEGPATITGNTVSDNTGYGVVIVIGTGTQLLGNKITGNGGGGVSVSGVNVLVGGPLAGNTIAFNGGPGVTVRGASTGVAVRGNAVFGNAGPGIDLGNDGLTANDPGDADDGTNHLQNAPVLVLASSAAAGTTVSGTLNSTPNTRFLIDFYATPPASEPAGMTYIGSGLVLTDAGGNADFGVTLPTRAAAGWGITATATTTDVAPFGDTSEFALGVPVFDTTPPNRPPVIADQAYTVYENSAGGTAVGTVDASDPDAGQTLEYHITAGNIAGAFAIDALTGRITVADPAALDYEATRAFTLTVRVTDSGSPALSSSAAVTVNLGDVNEPPVNGVPAAPQAAAKNQPLTFSRATGNAISVFDPDAGTAVIQVSLSVRHGSLTLGCIAGLTFQAGDGRDDRTMTFCGTIAAVNAALDGLRYTPNKDYMGAECLTITTNDLGSGLGDPLVDTDVVAIEVRKKR
ncbi:MAG TPA: right-handed parallel beta-helix repeat-containing protein [Gemmataceae bacterium]|nr:right-handed parallel beta-helix repeat-containing protein [Gemmataceae bacterium]